MTDDRVLHKLLLVDTYPFRGLTFEKGEGTYLIDDKGRKYIDFVTGYGVNIFGHGNKKINRALKEQIDKVTNIHGSFASSVRNKAASELLKRAGGNLKRVYFSNSGAEAIEAAIKFAIISSGKTKIVSTKGAYHGKTLGALSVTSSQKYKESGIKDVTFGANFIPYKDVESLENALDDTVAAFIVEPIQGESGIIVPPLGYLEKVVEVCRGKGVFLILDEIQTGVGRTGGFLASSKIGVGADIVCLGKGLAGGVPVGATLVTKEISDSVPKLIQTSTFGGNPLACSGVLATLSLLDNERLGYVKEMGDYFKEELSKIDSDIVKEVRGEGLLVGVEVKEKRNNILKVLQEEGVLAAPAGDNVVRFLPPYIVTEDEINKVIGKLTTVMANV